MYACMYNWVTMLFSRILTEYCKPIIMEKNKKNKKEQNNATFSDVDATRDSHPE